MIFFTRKPFLVGSYTLQGGIIKNPALFSGVYWNELSSTIAST
jgi:hypothetical protein